METTFCNGERQARVTIRLGFPGHVLFLGLCPGVRADFQKLVVCPVFAPIKAQSINMPEVVTIRTSLRLFDVLSSLNKTSKIRDHLKLMSLVTW